MDGHRRNGVMVVFTIVNAIVAGVGAYVGVDIPILALVLVLIGAIILVEPLVRRNAQSA